MFEIRILQYVCDVLWKFWKTSPKEIQENHKAIKKVKNTFVWAFIIQD